MPAVTAALIGYFRYGRKEWKLSDFFLLKRIGTMKRWMLNDFQAKFREIFELSIKEPQFVFDNNTPIAVILDIKSVNRYTEFPTIAELLDELDEIKKKESVDIEIPMRKNR